LPKGIGSNTPEEVADAVVRAIREDKGEINVAPAFIRVSAKLNGLAPDLVARLSRKMGSGDITRDLAEGQRSKR
jgi:hypothetical protein